MKNYIKNNKNELIIITIFISFVIINLFLRFPFGLKVIHNFKTLFFEMISVMPFIFILIGLFEVWVPKEIIQKHTGEASGIKGIIWMIILASAQMGSLYVAFPMAYMLWRKGTSVRNIFIYLGAFTTMKIPMISFEIGFLGLKFSLLRTLLSLPIFITVAIVMSKFFVKELKMNNPLGRKTEKQKLKR